MKSERIAVVDLGTNSTRLLVAEVRDGRVEEIERRTRVTRLGEGVDATGELSDEAMERVFDTLGGYRELIGELGATAVVGVATSAVRDAANGEQFRAELVQRFDIDARTIPGEEEARLTFKGATAGRSGLDGDVLVLDIGGGSTELVIGLPGREPGFHVSAELGSSRHTERFGQDVEALRKDARRIIDAEVPAQLREHTDAGFAVAGTATSFAAIDQELDPYDSERVDGYELGVEAAEAVLGKLAALPLEERREVSGLHPDRAPTIVAGGAILVEAMRAFGLAAMTVSEADLLHGAAAAAALEEGSAPGGYKQLPD